jgi:nitrilase
MTIIKAAAVQISPVLYSREGTVDKVVHKLIELGRQGVQFATFGETLVPYYPYFSFVQRPFQMTGEHLRLIEQAVTVPSDATRAIGDAAKHAGIVVSVGINERDGGTLYNTQLLFDADGTLIQRRRKITPTYHERMVWGQGDGSGLRAIDSRVGRIGQLACWEHYNPLARYALMADGEQIHSAMYPGSFWRPLLRADRGQHSSARTGIGVFCRQRHRMAGRRSASPDYARHRLPNRPDLRWLLHGDCIAARRTAG